MRGVMIKFLLLLFLSMGVRIVEGQEMRFGKYSQAEIKLTEVDFEPEANAVVLEEFSRNQFMGGIQHTNVHRRIKVLKESGKSNGDVKIAYYFGDDGVEMIQKFSAQIMNIIDGKEEVIMLSKKDYFEVDRENGWKEIRFTFPNVREGSIMEYEYLKIDKNITFLDSYLFQNEVPTLKSVYFLEIPPYLTYRMLLQGDATIKAEYQTSKAGVYKWTLTNLRSIFGEPYMNHYVDYLEKVEFQLAGYAVRNKIDGYGTNPGGYKEILGSWQELSNTIREIPDFNSYMNPNNTIENRLKSFRTSSESESDRAKEIYKYVTEKFKFNGKSGDIPSQNLKSLLDIGRGSRAEINLSLLAHLKTNNIESFPMLISSKGNGRSTLVEAPFAGQFNQLILMVKADGKEFFVDATDPNIPFGYLPLENHSSSGFILLEKESGLRPIQLTHRSGIKQMTNIKANEHGELISESTIRFLDYEALAMSKKNESRGEDEFKKEFFNKTGGEYLDFVIEDTDEPRKQLDAKVKSLLTTTASETIFLIPFQYQRWTDNPFQSEYRSFPVDFNYVFSDNYTTIIDIPEGFELDDFPEDAAINTPGDAVFFSYKITKFDGKVQINATLDLRRKVIEASHYPELKYFMEIVISKLKEPLVLKKISQP